MEALESQNHSFQSYFRADRLITEQKAVPCIEKSQASRSIPVYKARREVRFFVLEVVSGEDSANLMASLHLVKSLCPEESFRRK